MVMVCTYGLINQITKVSGRIINLKELVNTSGVMVESIMVNLRGTNLMEKDHLFMKMAVNIRANSKMTKSMVMVSTLGQMEKV